jgi:hypothetical protein
MVTTELPTGKNGKVEEASEDSACSETVQPNWLEQTQQRRMT